MAYTTIDDPSAYFQTVLWSGDNSDSRNITNNGNSDLQPDWVWIKSRSTAGNGYSHNVHDTSRGVDSNINKSLFPDVTDTEGGGDSITTSAQLGGVSAMLSDGFTVKEGNTDDARYVNKTGNTYVAWQWKANGGSTTTNDASATSVGTIDSVYQANTTARFSIVTYSGSGSAGTIAHGLGVTPNWVIIKNRGSSARGWIVYHDKSHGTPEENFTLLNTTAGVADLDRMNDTAPTSTVFSVSDDTHVNNGSDTYVAYCFANVQGYSKFGSYAGNNSTNGPFVYTGFTPAWVMIKRTDGGTNNWPIWDYQRGGYNGARAELYANLTNAEATDSAIDILSNGFKLRNASTEWNNGTNYIYMAFAEHPFVSSKGVPTTAR